MKEAEKNVLGKVWDMLGNGLFCEPIYFHKLFYKLKFRIAGQDDGIFSLGRGDRKAICKRERVLCFESCRIHHIFKIIWQYQYRQTSTDSIQKELSLFLTPFTIKDIVGFSDINLIHQNVTSRSLCVRKSFLDFLEIFFFV